MGKYNLIKMIRDIFPSDWQTQQNNSLTDVIIEGCFYPVNDNLGLAEIDYTEKVGYSIEKRSLEDSLNNRFDSVLDRIYIEQGEVATGGYVFNEDETIPEELEFFVFNELESLPIGANEAYVFNEGEAGASSASGFVVYAPISLLSLESNIRAWIERVQIYGTDYELIFF